jgi:ABC-type transport system involved in multi-copper enzyme maturation permease subunit
MSAIAPIHPAPERAGGLAVAAQMFGADFLKLRKRRGTLIWALVLALAPLVIFFVVRAVQHSSTPSEHGPAGGLQGFSDGLRLLALFMGPLAAILIGADAGAGDHAAGVFRDLVVTGRSRLALFATRVPAALALCWSVMLGGFAVLLIGTFAFASSLPTPDATLILEAAGFTLLATGVVCAVAVGFASLTTSRPAAITALIGWQLVASPLIANIESLGGARDAVLSQSLAHFSPVALEHGHMGADVTMGAGTAILVAAAWLAVFLALGAWRTRSMDA